MTLRANPGVDSTFEGWSGPCSGTGRCTVTMDRARSVAATFEASHLPDAQIAAAKTGPFIGKDVYGTDGSGEALTKSCAPGEARSFFLRVQNDGQETDAFALTGPTDYPGYTVMYRRDGKDITSDVLFGTLRTHPLAPGAVSRRIRVVIRVDSSTPQGSSAAVVIGWSSKTVPGRQDDVVGYLDVT